jgi:hypothetical protein
VEIAVKETSLEKSSEILTQALQSRPEVLDRVELSTFLEYNANEIWFLKREGVAPGGWDRNGKSH